jgi:hypothetical protein
MMASLVSRSSNIIVRAGMLTRHAARLWGPDKGSIEGAAGFDLEKVVWEEVIKANCQNTLLEECERLLEYYEAVFG